MMAGMAVGRAVGQNITGTMNGMMNGTTEQNTMTPPLYKTFIEQKKQDSLKEILLCMLPVLYVNFY